MTKIPIAQKEKFIRPVKCYLCKKQMYYYGDSEFEREYVLFISYSNKKYVHKKCLDKAKRLIQNE